MKELVIAGRKFHSRLFLGTGKFASKQQFAAALEASGTELVTSALTRVDLADPEDDILSAIDRSKVEIMLNTSGARTAEEAVRLARIARAAGCGNWIKIEVINDTLRLLPDGYGTAKATEILAKEGFVVFPYINPDLYVARACVEAGACCVMPLASPIGSNRGLRTKEMIAVLIDEMKVPVIVDAGLGKPSEACECMEMGAAACLVNTGIASARDAVRMAEAFGKAVDAGRKAYLAGFGTGRSFAEGASASSPLTGFLR